MYNLQDIFNLLPNLTATETTKAFAVKTNDELLVIYLSSLVRAVIALHNLIDNKISNRDAEKAIESGAEKEKEKKSAAAAPAAEKEKADEKSKK